MGMSASIEGLVGTIKDIAFMDDSSVRIISMNEPLSIKNAAVGRVKSFLPDMIPDPGSSLHSSSSRIHNYQWHHSSYRQMQINEVVDFDIQNNGQQFSQANDVN